MGKPLPSTVGIFDQSPIEIGGFQLKTKTAMPIGKPSIVDWQHAFRFASEAEEASPYWVGDLLAYGEDRADWREKFEQARSITKLAIQTIYNRTSLSRKVQGRARELAPTISHADVVKKLDAPAQEEWLEKARDEGWTVSELNKEVRAAERLKIIEGQADTMHTVDVTIRLALEAESPHAAEEIAWTLMKQAVALIPHAHVIAAHAAPHLGSLRRPSHGIRKSA